MLALLDFDEFHDLLLDATRDMLIDLKEEYEDQQLYAFYLFHDPLWGFSLPQVTIEGGIQPLPKFDLNRHIKHLVNVALRTAPTSSIFKRLSLEKLEGQILNTKRDSTQPLTLGTPIGREYFEAVNMWLLRAQFHRVTFTHKQMEQYHRTMTAICIDVLQALDKRGLFGEGDKRQQTVVNLIMMKDPNREWLQHAKDLNPPDVYNKWIEEFEEKNIPN